MTGKWIRIVVLATFCGSGTLFGVGGLLHVSTAGAQGLAPVPVSPTPVRQQNPPTPPQANPPARQNAANPYKPAKLGSAADVQFPFKTSADAIVLFDVALGARGEIKKISVLQDVPPFTEAAEHSLREWKFAPASLNGKAEESDIVAAFVFRHAVYIANPPAYKPVAPSKESERAESEFTPPGILSMTYAGYPASTVAYGTIVVQETVNPEGSASDVKIVRDLEGGFAPLAIEAAKKWRFQPAMRNGRAVPGRIAIAFVFSSRAMNPF